MRKLGDSPAVNHHIHMTETSVVIGLTTCPNGEVAATLARALVGEGLAACVNEIPGITSTYRWREQLHRDSEVLLLIKTGAERLPALERRLKELHPYELPEFITVGVCSGSAQYLEWIRQNAAPPRPET